MAVSVKLGETFESGAAIPLFQTEVSGSNSTNRYDVADDGQRFLVNQPAQSGGEAPYVVILNWTSTLKK
jgi:hypothetical protein